MGPVTVQLWRSQSGADTGPVLMLPEAGRDDLAVGGNRAFVVNGAPLHALPVFWPRPRNDTGPPRRSGSGPAAG